MTQIDRRKLLAGTALAAGAAAIGAGTALPRTAGAAAPAAVGDVITAADPRYVALVTGNNQRFVARPDYVKMIRSTQDAVAAVQEAVRAGKRLSVRSGGHCFSDFVCNPDVEVILDLSEMTDISYDPGRRAFSVQPGARLMNIYEELFKGWNVTLPGGICYSVGAGGHISGGGYGLLSRRHGLVSDHLYAVEVVVVDERGRARAVVATREKSDPHHDLWWAHTGGGGGNFGLITRFWFRSPDARGTEPADQLVAPPSEVLVSALAFPWEQLTEKRFARLLKNFGAWHAEHSRPDSPTCALSSLFNVSHKAHGSMGMFTQVDATVPGAQQILDDYLAAILDGVDITPQAASKPTGELPAMPHLIEPRRLPWIQATRLVGTNNPTITNPTSRGVHKSAYMRQNFSDAQVATLYKHMTGDNFHNPDTMLVLFSFGGQVNGISRDATANVQRDSIFKMCFQTFWEDAKEDSFYVGWARAVYEEFFATTGGVPVPGREYDGCYINYPDNDVANSAYNRSGVSWETLYYGTNYPRLQRVKRRYDPRDQFRHALSIRP
ncbi:MULTISPECIES: FAD-binding oxidoreductase [unclassified Micromonospora]|uniref:FAD-binding oxidoreductase n=1 Tax=unclassified Micromonospora TaxID=2617518 RepID=UPI00362D6821